MAVKLERTTQNKQLLKLVSVLDDAIDWEATYPDETSEPRKKSRYRREHLITDLVFLEGVSPTVFVWEHPARVDVARKIRGLYTRQLTGKEQADVFTEAWNKAYLGKEEGLDGAPREEAERLDGNIKDNFFQAVEDSGIFEELAGAFLDVAGQNKAVERMEAKKK